MTDTGITRKVDDLGRIVIPMELRRSMGIKVRDPLPIFVEGDRIVLAKPSESCAICGATGGDQVAFKGRQVCSSCIKELKKK